MFNRKYIFKGSMFHCYVRLPECNLMPHPVLMLLLHLRFLVLQLLHHLHRLDHLLRLQQCHVPRYVFSYLRSGARKKTKTNITPLQKEKEDLLKIAPDFFGNILIIRRIFLSLFQVFFGSKKSPTGPTQRTPKP